MGFHWELIFFCLSLKKYDEQKYGQYQNLVAYENQSSPELILFKYAHGRRH